MRTYLITGGTDGCGKAVAMQLLKDGERVFVVGSTANKGELFLAEAEQLGAKGRATFIRADLSLVKETHRVIGEITEKVDALDGLVFCAVSFKQRTEPLLTEEGFEAIFSLAYLSRFILSYELTDLLEKSADPKIVSFCSPGMYVEVQYDNIQYTKDFVCNKALVQSGKLLDHLGVSYAENCASGKTKYVLYNPGAVKTNGIYREMGPETIAQYEEIGRTAEEAVKPLMPTIINRLNKKLLALSVEGSVSLDDKSFDKANARKVHTITTQLLDEWNANNEINKPEVCN
jgi:NAD(P)-dependent dehydrogenase (short-subunit alcohol dehydrogenase family)